jgi:2-methylcitrate dehydratase PrpD
MTAPTEHACAHLGRFLAETRRSDLPASVRHEAKRSVLNFIGCALGAAREPAVDIAVQVLQKLSAGGDASLVGRSERLDIASAAFVNAIVGNLLDYDDTHLATVIHPTAPVFPAVLALGEQLGCSGPELLMAFVLGAEVECRIGNAVSPGHYDRGWHITATCGVFGAAAAAAKLLGLNADTTAQALGIAASQSAGLVENLATAAKNVGVGNAARNGLLAALFAQAGYRAAPAAIEGPRGWALAMGDAPNLAAITEGLGQRWEFARNTYKPYPAGIVMHAVIDACLQLHAGGFRLEDVASIIVRGDALLLARGDRTVHGERDAKVSIHHCVAAALLHGAAGVPEFSAPFVADPTAVAVRAKVRAELDTSLPRGAATVEVRTTDGRALAATVHHPRGSTEKPLSDSEIETKSRNCAVSGGSGVDPSRVAEAVWSLDEAASLQPLLQAVVARPGARAPDKEARVPVQQ